MSSISQMQMAYAPEQDRILFRLSTNTQQEFRFWLTRRFAMMFLKVLRTHRQADPDVSTLQSPADKAVVQDFKKEKAIEEANFEKKFENDAREFPIGEEAQLAFKLSYRIKDDGGLALTIQPKEGQGINVNLNQSLNVTLTELLLSSARKAQWRLDEWLSEQQAAENQPERVIN